MCWTCVRRLKTGGLSPSSLSTRQLGLYLLSGGRELFTATAGVNVPQTAVRAGKLVGFAAHIATGITMSARINKTRSN